MRIIFFGTPEIARTILERLSSSPDFKPVAVVTSPDEPVGRNALRTSPPVKLFAQEHHIPVLQPVKLDADFAEKLAEFVPELFIVVAYGKIFPQALLDIPAGGSINVHFSLLPLWRGASPIQNAILRGDKKTGTTLMLMDEKLDHGPILAQKIIKIQKNATTESLSKKLAELSADLLAETLPSYAEGKIHPQEQDHAKATYCKLLRKEDGLIDWSQDAGQIERMMRAFTPWPGSYTFWGDKRIKIHTARILRHDAGKKESGTVLPHDHSLAIQTGKGLLVPLTIQIEGKPPMETEIFLRGYPAIIGAILA